MTRSSFGRLGRLASRTLQGRMAGAGASTRFLLPQKAPMAFNSAMPVSPALFSTTPRTAKPLTPEQLKNAKPDDLTDADYHELSDEYLEVLLVHLEERQDKSDDIDVEYSVSIIPCAPAAVVSRVDLKSTTNDLPVNSVGCYDHQNQARRLCHQ